MATGQGKKRSQALYAAGVAMAVAGGGLAITMQPTRPAQPRPVALTAVSAEVQQAIDALLDVMKQAAADDAALPFATPDGVASLMTSLQNTNYELLMSGVSRVTELFDGWFFQSPEVIAGDAASPRQYFQFFTPDIYYHVTAGLAPGATYELTGTLGGGTEAFAIATEQITGSQAVSKESLELGHDLVVNPDGTFTVYIGPEAPSGAVNFIDDDSATIQGAASLLIRDMLGDWAKGPSDVSIHCVADCPPFFAIPEGGFFPSDDTVAPPKITSIDDALTTLFSAFAKIAGPFNTQNMGLAQIAGIQQPANTMSPLTTETSLFATGLPSADVSAGNFDLEPGQALIVKVPDVEAAYKGIELMNVYGAALPFTLAQTTLNNTTAFHSADGYTYYVVSATNPGVANWLDTGGIPNGEIFARFENLPDGTDPTGTEVTTQVVPVADVAQYLPDDTPTVSAAEYAADMTQRVLSYDYALDVSRMSAQPSWLIQQLLFSGLKGLIGDDNFAAVFGAEPETPLELRFTDALSPDWDAVWHGIAADPFGSLTAVVDNLPLLWSDISLPFQLAAAQSVLSLLLPGTAGSLLNDALLDPNSGIVAGLLNARDDLATVILTANDAWPTEVGETAAQQWANMSELVEQTAPTDLGSLFASLFDAG
ncbi:hypothetical protein [Mycolicibacter algericus]|uniref:DUF1214 domain-containing protein n=1 Tax=Mycolicibacter algericus DSM 45454 TaxID=723879 RepID=A0ABX3RP38_MYCAL|nr:hypothetical protein [Mycolicibacter algericus]OQZ95602.1 hypothetical protein BST10_14750 [Mycolicibacter algericus DSM 45454]